METQMPAITFPNYPAVQDQVTTMVTSQRSLMGLPSMGPNSLGEFMSTHATEWEREYPSLILSRGALESVLHDSIKRNLEVPLARITALEDSITVMTAEMRKLRLNFETKTQTLDVELASQNDRLTYLAGEVSGLRCARPMDLDRISTRSVKSEGAGLQRCEQRVENLMSRIDDVHTKCQDQINRVYREVNAVAPQVTQVCTREFSMISTQFQDKLEIKTVSYTHLTLPTTPYV